MSLHTCRGFQNNLYISSKLTIMKIDFFVAPFVLTKWWLGMNKVYGAGLPS